MQYIHYHNDFTVPISLVSDSITINPDIIGQITFYTRNNGNSYCCCRDCKTLYVDGDNVMAVLNSHNLETGVLNYMVEYQIPDSNFPDGFQRICQHYTSNIELTTENGDITVAEAQIIYGETIEELLERAGYSYTKEEIDEMIEGISAQVNTYTKPEIDTLLAGKANKNGNRNEDFVTRTLNLQREGASTSLYNYTLNGGEFVSFYDQTGSSLTYQFVPNQGDIIATERQLATKANSNDVYTKGQVDDLLDNIDLPDNVVTDANYVHTDNNYTTSDKNKLSGIASGAEVNVQSDWNVTDSSSDAFIKNKPTIPTVDSSITGSNQTNPVSGGAIYMALNGKAGFKSYQDCDDMENDTPPTGTIGFDSDFENFYIYNLPSGEWKRIDGGGDLPANVVVDANYVHTDNNFTTEYKETIDGLENQFTTKEFILSPYYVLDGVPEDNKVAFNSGYDADSGFSILEIYDYHSHNNVTIPINNSEFMTTAGFPVKDIDIDGAGSSQPVVLKSCTYSVFVPRNTRVRTVNIELGENNTMYQLLIEKSTLVSVTTFNNPEGTIWKNGSAFDFSAFKSGTDSYVLLSFLKLSDEVVLANYELY